MTTQSINIQTVLVLGILFLFYVIGDLVTTIWLVGHHPEGIGGESNPLAVLLYTQQGVFGLIFAKVIVFMAIATMIMILEFHYSHIKKIMMISNFTILGLMAWSLIIVTVNMLLIYTLSLSEGTYESEFITKTYLVIFAVSFAGLILVPKFIPSSLGKIELMLGAMVMFGPFAFSPGLYQFLLDQSILNLAFYVGINAGIIGLMIFSMNRLYKYVIPRK